jgi:hypothetical protein
MKRIIVLLFVFIPIMGFSQTDQELMDHTMENYETET